jgi:acyl-CoA reductase-like NAD-dependent aldehyde dehydrogenase
MQELALRLDWCQTVRLGMAKNLDYWIELVSNLRQCSNTEALTSELLPLLDALKFLETQAPSILSTTTPTKKHQPYWLRGYAVEVQRRPWGQILILAPGNYPLFLAGVQMAQAIVAGNQVQLKPPPGREQALVEFAQLWLEAGCPTQSLRVLESRAEAGIAAIEAGVDRIILTGSHQTGLAVAELAAKKLIPMVAELSGEDFIWVGPDADLELVAKALRWGRTLNHGQTCMAPQKVVGTSAAIEQLRTLYLKSGEQGAEFVVISSDQEALEKINSSGFALGASLFGNPGWARTQAAKVQTGFVTINDLIAPTADPRIPFGGRRASGYGFTRGAEGLLDMTVPTPLFEKQSGPHHHLQEQTRWDFRILRAYAGFAHGATRTTRLTNVIKLIVNASLATVQGKWKKFRSKGQTS